jgi:hypothetical protein
MALALLLGACGTEDTTGDTSKEPSGDTSIDTSADTSADLVTWYADIQPLVQLHCQRCHQEGGLAPFGLDTMEAVQDRAWSMLDAIDAGEMPPGASDPECRDYVGSDRLHLPAASRDLLASWIDQEMPTGDPSTAPAPPEADEVLAQVDLEVALPTRYVPRFEDASNPDNEYRCFYLDPGLDTAAYVSALHPLIDNPALVHHVVLFTAPPGDLPADYDPAIGEDCINNVAGNITGMMAAWAPGMLPVRFPEGVGLKVGADDLIVMQLHYYASTPEVSEAGDQSGYQFTLVADLAQEVQMAPLGTQSFTIPAGDAAYTVEFELEIPSYVPFTLTAYGMFPHMHVLGTGYRAWLEHEGEETCLVESDRYDFGNQMTYQYLEPMLISPGDTFHYSCTWDNSAENPNQTHEPPIDVRYGERTDEEMCYAFTYLSLAY